MQVCRRHHSSIVNNMSGDAGEILEKFAVLKIITRNVLTASLVVLAAAAGRVEAGQSRAPHCAPPGARGCASGLASWYGPEFRGHRTASGERFNPKELTAAHPSLPFQTRLKVTNPRNGRSVTVRVNDRGPGYGRAIDLSEEAAKQIGIVEPGVARVEIQVAQNE
jgi:peptidoglycan lytic transglycosylase